MIGPRDLPLLPVLVAVADRGSFTAAARALQLTKSVVSQHVRTLEQRLGVRLLERTTRQLHITQIGALVLAQARAVLGAVAELERVVERQREEPSGTLRVTLPSDLAIGDAVAAVGATLVRRFPTLRLELVVDDAVRDLVAEGLDVAIRLGALVDSSSVARRLGVEHEIIVASPAVVDARGEAAHPRALIGAPWVSHVAFGTAWTFRAGARTQHVTVDVRATTNTADSVRRLVVGGAGYAVSPAHLVHDDLRAGRLVRVCPAWAGRRIALYAVMPTRHAPPRVQAFLAALPAAIAQLGFAT